MKKVNVIFFQICFAFCIKMHSQITINNADLPVIGDGWERATDLAPAINIGTTGPNQNWNFSALVSNQIDTEIFILPGAAPLSVDFSAATFVEKVSNGPAGYSFGNFSGNNLNYIGFVGSTLAESFYLPPLQELQLPVNYQNEWSGQTDFSIKLATNIYPGFDSVENKFNEIYKDTIDAWGTLTTPLGVYNTVRDYKQQFITDSIWRHSISNQTWTFYQISLVNNRLYSWRSNTIHEKIVRVYVDSLNNPINAIWLKTILSTGIQEKENLSIQLFPNPVSDQLFIKCNLENRCTLKIFDILGNNLNSIAILDQTTAVNTSELENGIYFYELFGEKSEIIECGKFEVFR